MTFSAQGQAGSTRRAMEAFFGPAVARGVYRTPDLFRFDPEADDDGGGDPRPMYSVPESQIYFWSDAWQRAERESLDELERGEGVVFDDPAEAARWLLAD